MLELALFSNPPPPPPHPTRIVTKSQTKITFFYPKDIVCFMLWCLFDLKVFSKHFHALLAAFLNVNLLWMQSDGKVFACEISLCVRLNAFLNLFNLSHKANAMSRMCCLYGHFVFFIFFFEH